MGDSLPGAWMHVIREHQARYPLMQPEDVYKLLYQGILGSEHLIQSPSAFRDRLHAELELLGPQPAGLLWESVRPDEALGRLHLARYLALGGDRGRLAELCVQTAAQAWGTVEELAAVWAAFAEGCQQGSFGSLGGPEVLELAARMADRGWPPVHHSAAYRDAYRPAYRLLSRSLLGSLGVG